MQTSQLVLVFFYTAINVAGAIWLFTWLRPRLGVPPADAPDGGDDAGAAPASPAPGPAGVKIPPDFPYAAKPPLSPEDRTWLAALTALYGNDYVVYPHLAAESFVEPTKDDPGYKERIRGQGLDFGVCDRATGALVTGLIMRPGGKASPSDHGWLQTCRAAEIPLTVLDAKADPADEVGLRKMLHFPEDL